MRWLALAIYGNDLIPVLLFIAAYWGKPWRATPLGRQMMTFAVVTALLLLLGVISALGLPFWLTLMLGIGGHLTFAAIWWWRLALFLRIQHQPADETTPPVGTTQPIRPV